MANLNNVKLYTYSTEGEGDAIVIVERMEVHFIEWVDESTMDFAQLCVASIAKSNITHQSFFVVANDGQFIYIKHLQKDHMASILNRQPRRGFWGQMFAETLKIAALAEYEAIGADYALHVPTMQVVNTTIAPIANCSRLLVEQLGGRVNEVVLIDAPQQVILATNASMQVANNCAEEVAKRFKPAVRINSTYQQYLSKTNGGCGGFKGLCTEECRNSVISILAGRHKNKPTLELLFECADGVSLNELSQVVYEQFSIKRPVDLNPQPRIRD